MTSAIRPRLLVTIQPPTKFIRLLEHAFEIQYHDPMNDVHQEKFVSYVRAMAPDAILFNWKTRIDKPILTAAGDQLKMLATYSVGYDHIDVKECQRRGIPIGYTPG